MRKLFRRNGYIITLPRTHNTRQVQPKWHILANDPENNKALHIALCGYEYQHELRGVQQTTDQLNKELECDRCRKKEEKNNG